MDKRHRFGLFSLLVGLFGMYHPLGPNNLHFTVSSIAALIGTVAFLAPERQVQPEGK